MTTQHSCFICDKVAGSYRPHIGETVWYIGPVDGESQIACEAHKDSLEESLLLDWSEAWDAGCKGYYMGVARFHNPHKQAGTDRTDWFAGWDYALRSCGNDTVEVQQRGMF